MLNATIILFIGTWQIILVVAVILLLFGGRKIPELMKGLGQGVKEFKDATDKDDQKEESSKSDNKKNIEEDEKDSKENK